MGAADPISGTVSLLEIVRGLGTLLRQGWKPLRTSEYSTLSCDEYDSPNAVQLSLLAGMGRNTVS